MTQVHKVQLVLKELQEFKALQEAKAQLALMEVKAQQVPLVLKVQQVQQDLKAQQVQQDLKAQLDRLVLKAREALMAPALMASGAAQPCRMAYRATMRYMAPVSM